MVPLSSETYRRLNALFVGPDRPLAEQLLVSDCGDNLPLWHDMNPQGLERIRFAALRLSNGSLAELQRAVAIAKLDWRDVLVAAGFGNDVLAHEAWFPQR